MNDEKKTKLDREEEKEVRIENRTIILLLVLLSVVVMTILVMYYSPIQEVKEVFSEVKEDIENHNVMNTIENSQNTTKDDEHYVYTENTPINTNNTMQAEVHEESEPIKEFKVTSNHKKITENLTIFDRVKYDGKAIIYPRNK